MTIEITEEQIKIFEALLISNRDSKRLQKLTNCSYLESISHLNDIRYKWLHANRNANNTKNTTAFDLFNKTARNGQ